MENSSRKRKFSRSFSVSITIHHVVVVSSVLGRAKAPDQNWLQFNEWPRIIIGLTIGSTEKLYHMVPIAKPSLDVYSAQAPTNPNAPLLSCLEVMPGVMSLRGNMSAAKQVIDRTFPCAKKRHAPSCANMHTYIGTRGEGVNVYFTNKIMYNMYIYMHIVF